MALKNTNLLIQMAPLPVTFNGSPQDLFNEAIRRMRIVSPTGTNFIFIGDVEPTSNVGPWLKGGTQWWVWDDSLKRYQPLDVSESVDLPFYIGTTTPPDSSPPVWLRTDKDATDVDPSYGNPLGWYMFNGTAWAPYNNIVLSGPTSSRPAAPVEYQQYYDTTISCLIWWERAKWRTVTGVPGDVKAVAFETIADALLFNPGWDWFGASNQNFRGRIVMQAAKDAGTSPAFVGTVTAPITARGAFELFGETELVKVDPTPGNPIYPAQIALWHLVKT
jgi:hypothetical protein